MQLERTLFEVERVGDVSGFEIPGRYFDFVRRGDWSVLEPVLHHNRLDLLSLAGVTARAARLLRAGVTACSRAEEAALLGRELHRRAEPSEAEACYRRGLDDLAAAHPLRAETLAGLARLLRQPAPLRRGGGVLDGDHGRARGFAPACASRRPRPWRCTSSTGAATSRARTATPSGRGRPTWRGQGLVRGLGAPGPSAWIGGWTGCDGSCLEPGPGARPSGPRRDRDCSRGTALRRARPR